MKRFMKEEKTKDNNLKRKSFPERKYVKKKIKENIPSISFRILSECQTKIEVKANL